MSKYPLSRPWGRRLRASAAIATFLLVPATGCGLIPTAAKAQPAMSSAYSQPQTLQVTGQGVQTIPTTLTEVRLGVRIDAETAEEAQQQAATRSAAVIEQVRSQNVEKLQTTGISLSPRYDYSGDRQVLIGYQATNTISFRAPTEIAGGIIDEAVDVGATQIDGVSFVAEDSAIAAARQEALRAAVQDAQAQADTVLTALGLSRQETVNITIGSVSAPPPMLVAPREARALSVADASTPIIGQEQVINAQVTLVIGY